MEIKRHNIEISGQSCSVDLMHFNARDRRKWKELFTVWKTLKLGLRDYKSREPTFPEGLSEVAFCLYSGSKRYVALHGVGDRSFDTFNLITGRTEQVKASSVEYDLSSFGPRSHWDDLYFLDFFREGLLDGSFDVYMIPTKQIHSVQVNKKQTFRDQQKQGRRPRFSIKREIIISKHLKPLATGVKVWES